MQQSDGFIPLAVYNIIRRDSSLRDQELVDSRRLKKENLIFFELHFKRDNQITTVVFDKEGNHTNDYN